MPYAPAFIWTVAPAISGDRILAFLDHVLENHEQTIASVEEDGKLSKDGKFKK